jgi:glutaredoxin 3
MNSIKSLVSSSPVIVFSKDTCPFCQKLEASLQRYCIPYKKVTVTQNIRESLIAYTKCTTVPQLFINNRFIGGYTDFQANIVQILKELERDNIRKPQPIELVADF